MRRAAALEGLSVRALAQRHGQEARDQKGRVGALIERALGAGAGAQPGPDFPALGVELKTVPVDDAGRVRESTFVCRLSLRAAEELDFEDSRVLAKLRHVLFIPIQMQGVSQFKVDFNCEGPECPLGES